MKVFYFVLLFKLRYQINTFQSIPSPITKSRVPRVCLPEIPRLCFKIFFFWLGKKAINGLYSQYTPESMIRQKEGKSWLYNRNKSLHRYPCNLISFKADLIYPLPDFKDSFFSCNIFSIYYLIFKVLLIKPDTSWPLYKHLSIIISWYNIQHRSLPLASRLVEEC